MRTLYTLGYARPGALAVAEALVQAGVLLVDIRCVPRSRWQPAWNQAALVRRFGERYRWVPALGNRHYRQRGRPVELVDAAVGLDQLRRCLEQTEVCVICACADWRLCHRRVVAGWVQAAEPGCRVVHLEGTSRKESGDETVGESAAWQHADDHDQEGDQTGEDAAQSAGRG